MDKEGTAQSVLAVDARTGKLTLYWLNENSRLRLLNGSVNVYKFETVFVGCPRILGQFFVVVVAIFSKKWNF